MESFCEIIKFTVTLILLHCEVFALKSELTFSGLQLHFVRSKSTALASFSVVSDCSGKEQERAGLRLHAVVSEDSVHLKVQAHHHVISQFDLK